VVSLHLHVVLLIFRCIKSKSSAVRCALIVEVVSEANFHCNLPQISHTSPNEASRLETTINMASSEPEKKELGVLPASDSPSDIEKGSNNAPEDEKPFERSIPKWQWALVCVGLYLGAMLYGLDTTISASVQGPILLALGEIEKLAWVGIGFPMGSVSVILLLGWCFAVFEIKWLMIGSIVTFEAGSALCGGAPTMNAMVFGRVIAGIGGAGMYLGSVHLLSTCTPFLYNA